MTEPTRAEVIDIAVEALGDVDGDGNGTRAALDRVGAALRRGELVAMPTETVYGLACNALDPAAVQRVFEAKQRPASDPLIVHVDGLDMLGQVVAGGLSATAERLAERFWPGPLTMIVPRHPDLPAAVTSGLPDVAIRCPAHPVASAIITAAERPLAAPSANRFSHVSPTSAQHVLQDLGERIGLIVDAGRSEHGLESTVVAFDSDTAVVLRHGAIPIEELAEVVPVRSVDDAGGDDDAGGTVEAKASPGHDERHYSPRTPALAVTSGLVEALGSLDAESRAALAARRICFAGYHDRLPPLPTAWVVHELGAIAQLKLVAHDLYDSLRQMDGYGADVLLVELTGADGIGRAIDDRLTRAASSRVISSVDELCDAVERVNSALH